MTDTPLTSSRQYRALTVAERHRLLEAFRRTETDTVAEDGAGRRRMERWRSQPPFDVDEEFDLLLRHLEMNESHFVSALNATDEALAQAMDATPIWLAQLQEAYGGELPAYEEPLEGEEEWGFLSLAEPIIFQALAGVWQEIDTLVSNHDPLPFDVETIEDILLMNLVEPLLMRIGRTLVLELNVLRLQDLLEGDTARERFLSFLRRLHEPAVISGLFEEYPVLARQLVICVDQWASVSLEFLQRLCEDWDLLRATFSPDADPGRLVELTGGAGDTHRRGRSVMIAAFESDLRVVYKPKSLAIDIHFHALLDWLNAAGCDPQLRTLVTLDRGDYGWAEFVRRSDCENEEELRRFYRRQGSYLALLHVLNASDFHFENVIADGEHPMLIDLETMLQPKFDRFEETTAEGVAEHAMSESVLEIGLLPMRIWSAEGYEGIDISGLGGAAGQLTPDRIPGVADPGTDSMRYVRERVEIEGDANRPVLNGVEANAIDYIEDIVAGFESMYRLIARHRTELLRPGGLIDSFADDAIRVLLRPTRTYGQLQFESFHPDMLRDAIDRDLFFDRLWLVVPARRHMQFAVASEREDLLHGDIPVFTSKPSTLDLYDASDKPLSGILVERGIDAVRRRMSNLSEEGLKRQTWYIRASIATVAPDDAAGAVQVRSSIADDAAGADRARLLAASRVAADYLVETSVLGNEDATWIGLQPQGERYWTIASLGIDLYGGIAGIALFLAYAGALLDDRRYSDLARKAYASVLRQSEFLVQDFTGIGGFEGWGGILYAYTHVGTLWRDETVLAQAERVADIMAGVAQQDDSFDVVRGGAGAIFSLLALHAVRPSNRLVEAARSCGTRLVDLAEAQERGVGWVNRRFGESALAGFAYGSAGIAAALMEIYGVTGEVMYRDAALGALEYERSVYDAGAGNWRDLRTLASYDAAPAWGNSSHKIAWCYGATGIGLGRLATMRNYNDATMRQEIETSAKEVLEHGFGDNHSLCHGDTGNLELLLQASRLPDLGHLGAEVDRTTAALVASVERDEYQCGGPKGVLLPGLMMGVAGIGYELLRIAHPDRVPSVLTLEPPYGSSGLLT